MSTATDPRDEAQVLRVPPHSVEAEQSLLGGLLMDNRAFDRAADLVQEADFLVHEHQVPPTVMRIGVFRFWRRRSMRLR